MRFSPCRHDRLRHRLLAVDEHDTVATFPYRPGTKLLVAPSNGHGFVAFGASPG